MLQYKKRYKTKYEIISKLENLDFFLYSDGDLDQSQNLIGSKLDQDPTSDFS